ncbi:MAG: BACON domain-containing protein [Alistipes sp.]|nr:BACON domain-containing protein [Alistipes sp.]
MKKLFGLLAICALSFVACKPDTDTPEPAAKTPVVTLDKQSVEAPAEGGEFTVNYTIENAVEGVALSVVEDVEWISDATANEGVISFVVAANELEEARNATLNVEYNGAETRTIEVAQAAMAVAPKPELATFTLEVSDITWNNASITVTPSDDVEYILGVMTKEAFAPYTEDAETLVAARIAEWQETAQQYIDMGYDDPWQYYMCFEQRSGEKTYDVKYDDIYNMDWDSEYVVYCFGMNDEGEQTASVAVKEFRTAAPVPSNNTFTITIDAMTKSSVEFTVEPTTDEPYYVTIETVDVLAPYGPDKEYSYEDLIKYLTPDYDSTIEQRTFSGKQTITNSDLGKSVNGFKTYRVVVWGFENGPTTDVFMSEEFKPADPVVDFEPSIYVDEYNYRKVIYSVVPNSNATYYHALHTAAEVGEDGGAELAASLIEGNINANLISGTVQKEVEAQAESDYYVVVFGYDPTTATMTSEVFLSELITTPAEPTETPTINVEVTNLAWNGADIYVTPSSDFKYYYECRTRAEFDERYGSAEAFFEKVYAGWESDAASYGYDTATVASWYTNEGSGVADIGQLRWSTDYVFAIFGVDAEANLITEVTLTEFTTLTPAQSSNEFTITINSLTKSSVNFTVTPTNNDQYYVTVEKVGTVSNYGPDKEKSYDELIAYLLPEYNNQLTPRLFTGEQTITNSQLSKSVNGFSDYVVVVWGFNNGPTTTVFMSEPFRPADPE